MDLHAFFLLQADDQHRAVQQQKRRQQEQRSGVARLRGNLAGTTGTGVGVTLGTGVGVGCFFTGRCVDQSPKSAAEE